jgi:hypothetical protein
VDNDKNQDLQENWPVIDEPERAKEAAQYSSVKQLLSLIIGEELPQKITPSIVRSFLQVCELAATFEQIRCEDSVYRLIEMDHLPFLVPNESITECIEETEVIKPVASIPGIDDIVKVVDDLKQFQVNAIDDELLLALDSACESIWNQREIELRCKEQLEETDDAVQRAMIFLEMGKEDEARSEFQKISSEEILNPENALDLVELSERFQNKESALRSLRRWFVLSIALHPLTFDLIADVIFPGLISIGVIRLDHLRKILSRSDIDSVDILRKNIELSLPAQTAFLPDQIDVESRLKIMGLNLSDLNLNLEDEEEICLYTLLTELTSNLNRFASLANETNFRKAALNALERCVLGSLVLLFLPPRPQDIQYVLGYGSYNICHEWIVETLQEAQLIFQTIKPQSHSERSIAARLSFHFESLRLLIEKLAKKQIIPTKSEKSI